MIDILAQGRAKARMPRSLILAPTRELANQVAENFTLYGKYHKLAMALLIGGESFVEQQKVLSRGVDVLIATPGRLMDLFDRGQILLSDVKVLVIDEADRMLDMGFIPDVERIVSLLPPLRQTLFFSATMDTPIRKLADAFLSNPKEVRVAPKQQTASTVAQHLLVIDEYDKREALRQILRGEEEVRNAFIFCNRKRDVSILFRSLKKHGFDVAQLHGDMPQQERTATLAQFKAGDVKLLVCSDVAARGIDIADVSHVFNFDVPSHAEDYVHRIGRTGRAGREGRAFTLATSEDTKSVGAIEKLIGNVIPRLDLEGVESQELSEEAAKAARKARRSGGTDRRRTNRRDDSRKRDSREAAAPEQAVEATTETPSETPTSAPVVEARTESRSQDARGQDSRADSRNRRDRGRGGRRNHPAWEVEEMEHGDDVMAFGDHTPAFMLVDVSAFVGTQEDLISDEDADRLEDEIVQVLDEIEEVDTADEVEDPRDEDSAPRSRNRRSRGRGRGRNRDRDEVEASDSQEAEAAEASGTEGAEDDSETETSATKPRRRRSARRRKSDSLAEQAVADDVADDGVAEPVAAEPVSEVESSSETAETAPVADADAVEEVATEKPKRAPRRRKAAPAVEEETAAPVDAPVESEAITDEPATAEPVEGEASSEEPTAKPKRTRKPAVKKTTTPRSRATKAKAAEAVESEAPTAAPEEASEEVTEKPKRTRKPAVRKATTPRTRKKAADAETTTDAPAEGEAVTEKPKRTRKPKVTVAPDVTEGSEEA
jgi:superfamily II DNA/RNA helicase